MIKVIIDFLTTRLQSELPFHNIKNENIDKDLKDFIVQQQNNTDSHRICAVMLAMFEHEGEIYIPCILRPQKSRVHAGQVALPGGGREEIDKNLDETAIRETWEEIGVNISQSRIIGDLSDIYVPPSNSLITPKIAFLDKKPNYKLDPNEVDKIIEVPLSRLLGVKNHVSKTVVKNGQTIHMPAIEIEGHLIWGATARILREFTLLIKEMEKIKEK